MRFDGERVGHLQMIQSRVLDHWQQKEKLPLTLDDLEDPLIGFIAPQDPQTGLSYGYRVISDLTFSLCANFSQESSAAVRARGVKARPVYLEGPWDDVNWEHGVGEKCFERTIDPEIFPKRK